MQERAEPTSSPSSSSAAALVEARSPQITTVRCEMEGRGKKNTALGKQPGYLSVCVFTRKQRLFSVGAPSFFRHVPGFFTVVVMHSGSAHLPLIITPRLRYAEMLLHEQKHLQGREKRMQATGIGHDIHIQTENNRGFSKYGLVEQIHTPCDHRDAPCDYIPCDR